MNAIFYRDEAQKQVALESLNREAHRLGITHEQVATKVVPVNDFTYAEGYHQKYSLSRSSESRLFLEENYATAKELADSTVATRLNAYLGSGMRKDWAMFAKELPSYGLPDSLTQRLKENAVSRV